MDYGLIVVGGGLTGVAAALSAAREGVKVLLVERRAALGGAAGNCLVNPFMRYFVVRDGEKHIINDGIFLEILTALKEMGGLDEDGVVFNEEFLKVILDRMCRADGVQVLFHTALVSVACQNGRIDGITVAGVSGQRTLKADCYIDCTGDGSLAAFAGCPFTVGRDGDALCQPMTLCFRLGNVSFDTNTYLEKRAEINRVYNEFQRAGKIKNIRENVLMFKTLHSGVLHFNTTRVIKRNPLDEWDLSQAEAEAREQVLEMYNFLKDNIPGFERACLLTTASEIGVRESRMIRGEYRLTADDILGCVKFEDAVACGAYSIDIHNPDGTGTVLKRIEPGNYYTIPYRSLVPVGMQNLLVAGRCISSTHEAQAAYRVMPIVCCIGQSAGLAAALFLRETQDFKRIQISNLHKLLEAHKLTYR